MSKFQGITTKVLKDGSKNIMVRFKHLSITYPIKNFTKLFGCKTQKQAFDKLQEIKSYISKGQNPFEINFNKDDLNSLFYEKLEKYRENKKWSYHTCRNNLYFYNKHIKNEIGHKKISKIKYEDILKIVEKFGNNSNSSINYVLSLLNPIFKEQVKKGNIYINEVDKIDKVKTPIRERLELRTNTKELEIIKELYTNIKNYDFRTNVNIEEIKNFFYLTILTSHRWGEILQLRKSDCYLKQMKIISPKTITKTKIDYHFPLPLECVEYIKNCKTENLFTIKRGTIYGIFQNLLSLTNVEIYKNKKISLHDTRKMMMSIMIKELHLDSLLVDYCLEHKQDGTIKHYLEFNYDDKEKSYKKYWDLIRN